MAYRCSRNIRTARSLRKRNDSEDEAISLDWSKPMTDNLQEILFHITRKEGVSKNLRLAYLNCFTKLCTKYESVSHHNCGLTIDQIFCCLRVSLFHEAGEVRAAGLRAMRYLLKNEEAVESLCRVNLPLLICRSLDIVLDNRLERIQALRLVRQLLSLDPKRFPSAITRCLVSIAKDGIEERDMLVRACWATLTELTVLNPSASASCGGLSVIIKSVLQANQTHNITEALISSILFLLNSWKTRKFIRSELDLQHFIAPFTDVHGCGGEHCETVEQRLLRYNASKNALITVLRSWPGIIYMCRTSSSNQYVPNGIESLINMLHLPYTVVHKYILELIFELFYLKPPEWTDEFETALISSDPSSMQDSWLLCDEFVVAEGKCILPHFAKHRLNLVKNYLALLLYSFISYGLIEALIAVILNPDDSFCSTYAIILLGELLNMASSLLPSDCAHRCHSLPTLISASTSQSANTRNLANAAIINLNRIHELKKRAPIPFSLYLDQMLQFYRPINVVLKHEFIVSTYKDKSKSKNNVRKNFDDFVMHLIKNSQVLGREYNNWDFDVIDSILKSPGDALKKLEDTHHKVFIKKLLQFYKPSSKLFSQINNSDEISRITCIVGQHFQDFLIDCEESKFCDYIDEYFTDLDDCISKIAVETPPHNAILSPARLLSTLSHTYFLFIGRLTNSIKGRKLLEKYRIYRYLLDLISLSSHDVFIKLIVSSIDYSNEFSRTILRKALTCSSEFARIYATNYLRVLFRAGISDFSEWATELLVLQLYDKCSAVSLAAVDVLDEVCDSVDNLKALISLHPSLLHIGDSGLLLLVRYLSLESGFKFLHDSNFIEYELNRWQKNFNLKYVKIVEDLLNECFTCHQRSQDGTYGRRSDKRNTLPKNAFIPPHLYGQLAQTTEGYQTLLREDCLSPLYQVIRCPDLDTELGIIRLKAAIWAVAHVGTASLGIQLINEADVIPLIVHMASESPIYSVRGTCFFALSLLATTIEGSELLKEYGWESIRHTHHEKFPIVEENLSEECPIAYYNENRHYTWSLSSTATKSDIMEWTDIVNELSYIDCNDSDNIPNSGSTPSICIDAEALRHKKSSLPSIQSPYRKINLPRVASLSPNHLRTIVDLRPRSSSDCQSAQKPIEQSETSLDIIGNDVSATTDNDSNNGIWIEKRRNKSMIHSAVSSPDFELKPTRHDSGLIADENSATNALVNNIGKSATLTVMQTSRRKISEPGIHYGSLPREERSDSNESSQNSSGKSRSGSFAESTSGVSAGSCDSTSQTLFISQRPRNNLTPIASQSSISNSLQSNSTKSSKFSGARSILSRIGSKSFMCHSTAQDLNSTDMIPTARDARGYATLKAIQKRRVQSLGSGMCDIDFNSFLRNNGDNYNYADNISSRKSSVVTQEHNNDDSNDNNDTKFMGLCMPINLSFIFGIEIKTNNNRTVIVSRQESNNWKTHLDRLSTDQILFNNGLELHNEFNCLSCYRNINLNFKDLSCLENRFETGAHISELKPPLFDNIDIPFQVLNRREILRFVTSLNGCLFTKQSEQGLLSLKQKCPSAFEDICLYSEISVQLATYNFRMTARRFLQELFLDINFDEIYAEADTILRQFASHVSLSSTLASNIETVESVS